MEQRLIDRGTLCKKHLELLKVRGAPISRAVASLTLRARRLKRGTDEPLIPVCCVAGDGAVADVIQKRPFRAKSRRGIKPAIQEPKPSPEPSPEPEIEEPPKTDPSERLTPVEAPRATKKKRSKKKTSKK